MSESKLHRTLVIGIAGRGCVLANAVKDHPAFELTGLADLDASLLDKVGDELHVTAEHRYGDYHEALASDNFDAVICAASTFAHFKITSDVLSAGIHCLTEKPLTLDLNQAEQLADLADQKQRVLAVGQNYRFELAQQFIAAVVREKRLGRLSAVTGRFHRHRPPRPQDAAIEHPLLFIQSIHHLDWLLSILPTPLKSVQACNRQLPWSPWQSPSVSHILLQCEDGVVASYSGSYDAAGEISPYGALWRLEFEHGDLVTDHDNRIWQITERGEKREMVFDVGDNTRASELGLLDTFDRAIADGVEPPTSARQNLATLKLLFDVVAAGGS